METKIEYIDNADRERLLSENPGLSLIEDQIHFDGNFLIFSGTPRE